VIYAGGAPAAHHLRNHLYGGYNARERVRGGRRYSKHPA